MKKLIYITALFILFGACKTNKSIIKAESKLNIEKNVESSQGFNNKFNNVSLGKSLITESSTVEEMTIKKPSALIELTANFKIDSTATLRGDTALKLVDVSDKNISVTIYQNGKNGQLTAKIKSKNGTEDVPFSEIKIRKATTSKTANVDTTKTVTSETSGSATLKDRSKVVQAESKVEKYTQKVNYLALVGIIIMIALGIYFFNSK
ncbi:hypothetical protein [Pedobacter sp. CFBP9032]|uniref:hypothetical protein n=1 Tax=Pedobacter sp. CFBP9032 TaxID=3096539 RepID=UPI002A6B10AA|nr:hypothetical protein [Pedobacter sp. CFBP9032]MDY0906560.1 hypothetical protein [Pedobacter sp. CFBP9032]